MKRALESGDPSTSEAAGLLCTHAPKRIKVIRVTNTRFWQEADLADSQQSDQASVADSHDDETMMMDAPNPQQCTPCSWFVGRVPRSLFFSLRFRTTAFPSVYPPAKPLTINTSYSTTSLSVPAMCDLSPDEEDDEDAPAYFKASDYVQHQHHHALDHLEQHHRTYSFSTVSSFTQPATPIEHDMEMDDADFSQPAIRAKEIALQHQDYAFFHQQQHPQQALDSQDGIQQNDYGHFSFGHA